MIDREEREKGPSIISNPHIGFDIKKINSYLTHIVSARLLSYILRFLLHAWYCSQRWRYQDG